MKIGTKSVLKKIEKNSTDFPYKSLICNILSLLPSGLFRVNKLILQHQKTAKIRRNTFNTLFYVKRNQINKNGNLVIMVRITISTTVSFKNKIIIKVLLLLYGCLQDVQRKICFALLFAYYSRLVSLSTYPPQYPKRLQTVRRIQPLRRVCN